MQLCEERMAIQRYESHIMLNYVTRKAQLEARSSAQHAESHKIVLSKFTGGTIFFKD
jgi:hypothetical protein